MRILVVDDSITTRLILKSMLEEAGYSDIILASNAFEALDCLEVSDQPQRKCGFDLIFMDIVMDEMNGIEACRRIKNNEKTKDIPVIMITGRSDVEVLKQAFEAGAHDYLIKPVNKTELWARTSAALRLKREIDRRVRREQELLEVTELLEEANRKLQRLSSIDGLTEIANRRQFDHTLNNEWKIAIRHGSPFSIILIDIDFFKLYNDTLGHAAGDNSLKNVAKVLEAELKRSEDLVARNGGEEFGVVLPNTDLNGALVVAERLRLAVEQLKIPHPSSPISNHITISLGVCSMSPTKISSTKKLLEYADRALYRAKENGRNRVEHCVTD